MTTTGHRRLTVVFTFALLALAFALTGTAHATLTGSAFDTSNGTEAAATALTWQNVAGSPQLGTELGGTTCFGAGNKELTPSGWTFVTGTACSPSKSDLLGMFSYNETTASDSFLHLAWDRAATAGDTFISFELNQSNATWTNTAGATIPCRTNNDLLVSYQLGNGSVTITAYKWTGDGTGPVACPNGASGTFTQVSTITEEGSVNAATITNYLATGALGTSFAGGAFGEGTLDVQSVIQSLGLGCVSYIQVQAHTRSSASISSSLIAFMAPVTAHLGNCAATGTVYNNTAGDGTHHAGESGLSGVTVYADMTNAGHYVAGDPTTTTDANGYYLLPGVAVGSHPLAVVLPAGYECTSPASPCTYTVNFSTTANAINQNFELYSPPPPLAPTLASPANGLITNNNEPAFTATGDPGARIDFYLDGTDIGNATADVSGVATLTPSSAIADGLHTAYATETNSFGGVSASSNVDSFTIDTVAPSAPVITAPVDGTDTNNTTPTLTATAEPGSTVAFYEDAPGSALLGTAVANGSGVATLTLTTALADASYSIHATATDAASNVSSNSAEDHFTIDTVAPAAPVLTAPADGSLTNNNVPTLTATGSEPGSTVTFYVDGSSVAVGTATADASGNASLILTSALADGQHSVYATDTDAADNVSADSNTNTFTVDATAPAAPTLTTPADSSFTNNNEPTLNATGAEAGSTVTFYIDGSSVGTATADGSGNASLTLTSALSDGSHSAKATDTDAADNTSADSNVNQFTVDTVAPAAPAVTAPADGSFTNNNEPTLNATGAEGGSTVTFYIDGSSVGTATADGSGNASLTLTSALSDGSHSAKATDTDAADNVSGDSNINTFTVKTSVAPPVVTTPADSSVSSNTSPTVTVTGEPGDTVAIDIDGTSYGPVTLDGSGNGSLPVGPLSAGQHAVKARQTDAASNVSAWSATSTWTIKTQTNVHLTAPSAGPTATNEPTVTYNGEAGDDFTLKIDGTTVATGVIPVAGTGSVPLTSPLSDGSHTIAIVATDAASNQASDSVVVNVVTSNGRTVQFTQAPAQLTQQTTADFAFTDGSGTDTYQCSLDGAAFGACPTPDPLSGLGNGSHTLVVRGVDNVGNRTAGAPYTWVVDNIAPPAPPILGGPNSVTTPGPATFTISAEPGDTLQCSLDSSAWGPCPSVFTLGSLPVGRHVLQVRQTDQAGNVSAITTYVWTVVTKPAPTAKPTTVKLVVAAKATVYNRTTVDVGCNLNAGMVKTCTVSAWNRGKLVGTGLVRYATASHQRTVIHVRLNALGKRLMSHAKNGLAVRFTGTATAFNVQSKLAAATRSTLFGPVRFVLGDVLFDTGSATLTPRAHAIVSQLARRLKGVSTVRCEGYTDSVGSPSANMALGLNRARAVCSLLRADGVHAVYRVVSYGASRPVASNATIAGRRTNRRVVVWVSYHDVP
jgi:outer membrane protein OmpA-like peptidoglycan-associated protein